MAYYLQNKDLLNEVLNCKNQKQISKKFLDQITLMIKEFSKPMKYKDVEERYDCESEAMYYVIKYWDRFDETISRNAFSYYTQIIKNGFAQSYNKYHPKKMKTIKIDSFEIQNF